MPPGYPFGRSRAVESEWASAAVAESHRRTAPPRPVRRGPPWPEEGYSAASVLPWARVPGWALGYLSTSMWLPACVSEWELGCRAEGLATASA
jgi:hypothetical protein